MKNLDHLPTPAFLSSVFLGTTLTARIWAIALKTPEL